MALQKYVRQLRPIQENYVDHVEQVQDLFERVDTTLNASITELFPALAFNNNYKPSSVEDFKKFLYTLNLRSGKSKGSFAPKDASSAKLVLDKLPSLDDKFLKTKMENAIGITNFLYNLHRTKPIKNVIWGYRAKPRGVPNNHAGDIFVEFRNKEIIGISLKAGTAKSKEPLKNTYVGTQYRYLGIDTKSLESDLWDRVYSKVPGVKEVATKNNFIKNKDVTKAYVDYYVEDESGANELYKEMLVGDDIVDIIPLITRHYAYLNKSSVQEYLIDVHSPEDKKTLKMTIRSDSGVRPEKGTSGQGRLGQYIQLKMQYSGVQ